MSVAPNDPTFNLKSEIVNLKLVNLKYKTYCFILRKRKLHWCHFAFQYSVQRSVEDISCIILVDLLYKSMRVVHPSSDNE